jgi:hypothetical protein
MIPAVRDIEEYRGDGWRAWGVLMDNQLVPQIVDLQTAVIRVQVRKRKGGDILLDITNGSGVEVDINNQWSIDAPTDFQAGKHYWDFQVTQVGQTPDTYYAGRFTLIDDVTRI